MVTRSLQRGEEAAGKPVVSYKSECPWVRRSALLVPAVCGVTCGSSLSLQCDRFVYLTLENELVHLGLRHACVSISASSMPADISLSEAAGHPSALRPRIISRKADA